MSIKIPSVLSLLFNSTRQENCLTARYQLILQEMVCWNYFATSTQEDFKKQRSNTSWLKNTAKQTNKQLAKFTREVNCQDSTSGSQ